MGKNTNSKGINIRNSKAASLGASVSSNGAVKSLKRAVKSSNISSTKLMGSNSIKKLRDENVMYVSILLGNISNFVEVENPRLEASGGSNSTSTIINYMSTNSSSSSKLDSNVINYGSEPDSNVLNYGSEPDPNVLNYDIKPNFFCFYQNYELPFTIYGFIPKALKIEMAKLILDRNAFESFLHKNTNKLSDHNPISCVVDKILIISWNVMNNGSMSGDNNIPLFNKIRARIIIKELNNIINKFPKLDFKIALQECPGYVYKDLKIYFEKKYGPGTSEFCFQNIASCVDGNTFIRSANENDKLGGFAFFNKNSVIGDIYPVYITDTVCTAPDGTRSLCRSARAAYCKELGILNVHLQKCKRHLHEGCENPVCPNKRIEKFCNGDQEIFGPELYIKEAHKVEQADELNDLLESKVYNEATIKSLFQTISLNQFVRGNSNNLIVGDFNMTNLNGWDVLKSEGVNHIMKNKVWSSVYNDNM